MRWKRHALVFAILAVTGLGIWVVTTPSVAGRLFGEGAYEAAYSFALFRFFGLPLLLVAAAVAGFASPRGFFLWGVALVFLHPVAEAWQTGWAHSRGAFGASGIGASQLVDLAVVTAMVLFVLAMACTVAAALGASLRLLWWWSSGESVGGRLGLTSRDGASA